MKSKLFLLGLALSFMMTSFFSLVSKASVYSDSQLKLQPASSIQIYQTSFSAARPKASKRKTLSFVTYQKIKILALNHKTTLENDFDLDDDDDKEPPSQFRLSLLTVEQSRTHLQLLSHKVVLVLISVSRSNDQEPSFRDGIRGNRDLQHKFDGLMG